MTPRSHKVFFLNYGACYNIRWTVFFLSSLFSLLQRVHMFHQKKNLHCHILTTSNHIVDEQRIQTMDQKSSFWKTISGLQSTYIPHRILEVGICSLVCCGWLWHTVRCGVRLFVHSPSVIWTAHSLSPYCFARCYVAIDTVLFFFICLVSSFSVIVLGVTDVRPIRIVYRCALHCSTNTQVI